MVPARIGLTRFRQLWALLLEVDCRFAHSTADGYVIVILFKLISGQEATSIWLTRYQQIWTFLHKYGCELVPLLLVLGTFPSFCSNKSLASGFIPCIELLN